jgi:carbon storage regulator
MRRRAGDGLRIGDDVEIEVLEITATRVVLGIKAPATIRVVRKEVLLAAEENRAAAGGITRPLSLVLPKMAEMPEEQSRTEAASGPETAAGQILKASSIST